MRLQAAVTPPGDPPGPRRLSKPGGLALTPGPPQSWPRRARAGASRAGQDELALRGGAAASRVGPVLVRAGAGRRPPGVRAAVPGAGAGFVACAHRPITPFMGPSPRPAPPRSGS